MEPPNPEHPALEEDLRTEIIFRNGALGLLGDAARAAGGRRALVVTDPGVERAGHTPRALAFLAAAGIETRLFDRVVENPTDRCCEEGTALAASWGPDLIVAVGGGSTMDAAKGIGILLACGGRLEDYRGVGRVPASPRRSMPPLIAVPTTAGTGSEVQSAALISRQTTHEKMLIWDRKIAPRAAILDPELSLSLPAPVTAATGIDALSHSVESYVSTEANPCSRGHAREAFALLFRGFPEVIRSPGDLAARGRMLHGAALAGLSIEHSMLGAAHAGANPLTHRFAITHGVAVGLLLPHVVRFNAALAEVDALYGELLALAGPPPPAGRAGERLAAAIESYLDAAGLPRRLRDLAVREDSLEEMSLEAASQRTAQTNPRPVTASDLREIYKLAF